MNRQTVQKIGMGLFMVFIAFQILTPPSNNNVYHAPNGTQQARLKTFYYTEGIPSYKVYTRTMAPFSGKTNSTGLPSPIRQVPLFVLNGAPIEN